MAKRNRHKRRKGNASDGPANVESSKDRASSQARPKQDGGTKGGAKQGHKRRKKEKPKEPEKEDDFYFSDSNLRRDRFMKQTLDGNGGYLDLSLLLTFNRIKALGVSDVGQLVDAVHASELLQLNAECTQVRRDFEKFPQDTHDPVNRTLYAEGLPITFGIRDIEKFFSQYGEVKFVQIPHHRETGEPRGFCLVEFESVKDAETARSACSGSWPSTWPQRHDGKTLQLMYKADWLRERREYNELYKAVKGPSFQTTFTRRGAPREEVPSQGHAGSANAEPSQSSQDVSPTESAKPSCARRPRGTEIPGCLVKLAGFSEAENVLCIRQYVEHAVTVAYCDYIPNSTVAHVRLLCPGDCVRLLEDMKLTGRLLGCHKPTAEVLSPEEEEKYWQDALARHSEPKAKKRGLAPQAFLRRDVDSKVSRIRRWRPKALAASHKFRAGFTDTAGSNADFVPAGFGKRRTEKPPKIVPPRESGEPPLKVRRQGSPRRPLVPPPSPFQLPGTTRTRPRPARRSGSVPPSPCVQDSPESDSVRPASPSSSKQAVTSPRSEPGKAEGPVSPPTNAQEAPSDDLCDMPHPDAEGILDLLDELEGDM